MTHRPKPTGPVCRGYTGGRLLYCWLAIACLCLGLTCIGCTPSESPPDEVTKAPEQQPPAEPPSQPPEELPAGAAAEIPVGPSPELPAEPPAKGESTPLTPVTGNQTDAATEVLQGMVDAYKQAPSYADAGQLHLKARMTGAKIDESANFSLTLVRPNKIRMEVYQAVLVCDGKQLRAAIQDLPGQVLSREAPAELSMEAIYADPILAAVLNGGLVGASRQLVLLWEDDPLVALMRDVQDVALGKPGTIAGRDYYQVELKRAYGTTVLWIDKETYVLRRMVFPTEQLRREFSHYGTVDSVSLVADFEGAQLGGEVDPEAFAFSVPEGADLMKFFVPPQPAQLLGKKVPDFKFVDFDKKPVTPESLGEKITVLEFWSTTCSVCRMSLPSFETVRQQYKDNHKLAFFVVSVDEPEIENATLRRALDQLGVHAPIIRDLEMNMGSKFASNGTPTRFIIDGKGVVQDAEAGINPEIPDLAADLSAKLAKLIAGEDIYREPLAEYRKMVQQRQRRLEAMTESRIADRTQPKTVKLARLWTCTEVAAPGNILPLKSSAGRWRLLVVDSGSSVAEVGLDGKLIANHQLQLDPTEAVSNLRTAADGDGRRYFAAFSFGQQRFHLLDQSWTPLLSFPQDALENNHPGIADVQLADLQRDGKIEVYVAYRGAAGLQQVSLEGKRLWSNRSISALVQIAVGGTKDRGPTLLVCTSQSGALTMIDSQGKRLADVTLPGRFLHRIVAADLDGDGQPHWCGLAAQADGSSLAIGLNLEGAELWSYALPAGIHRQPIEPVIAGRLLPGAQGQWLLPGPDGSIHVLGADGKLLDSFNYGAELTGLATAELDGKPLLIVSTPDGLEAWKVE